MQFTTAGHVGNHASIITTAPDNTRTYFRGGPTDGHGNPSSGPPGQVTSGSGGASSQGSGSNSNSGNGSSPGSGHGDAAGSGPWGNLTAESGEHKPGSREWAPDAPRQVLRDDDGPCDSYNKAFQGVVDQVNGMNQVYNPFTTNSNAVAHEMLRAAGVQVNHFPVTILPGWNTRLFK